jgi:hypothetical protein
MAKKNSPSITSALRTIASELTEIQTRTDKNGQTVQVNVLAYAQKRVLNGICYSTALTMQRTQQDLDDAKQKVIVAARSHRGDELSELALNRAVDWAERLELQLATLDALLNEAIAVYEAETGSGFEMPTTRPTAKKEYSTAGMERAKRFAIGSPEVPQNEAAP